MELIIELDKIEDILKKKISNGNIEIPGYSIQNIC